MSKRYFLINPGRYGGEVVVGQTTSEFVEYWQERDESDLISHVFGVDWQDDDDIDSDSPDMTADGNISWHEMDDIEHLNGPYEDNQYAVTEITLVPGVEYVHGELVWKDGVDHDYATAMFTEADDYDQHNYIGVFSREAYSNDLEEDDDTFIPIFMMHSAEKGSFGDIVVETDENGFDPEKFTVGTVETDLATIVEHYFYDGRELEVNWDSSDTTGKGTYVSVGWMNTAWHDVYNESQYQEYVAEYYECLEEG